LRPLDTILAAWTVAPILLWQNGFTVPETSANVPLDREWIYQVRDSWEPIEPPRQARRLIPQGTEVAAEWTPYSRLWLGGVVAQWTQDDPAVRTPRHLAQEAAAAADSPIPGYRPWLKTALDSWAPAPVLIWQNGILVPDGVDQIPADRSWFHSVRDSWEAQPYSPQGWRSIVQAGAAPATDDPPFGVRPWLSGIVAQWTQGSAEPQARRYVVQVAAAAADAPPTGYRPWLKTALGSWEPAPVLIWQNGVLVPSGVDQIPTSRPWLATVLREWEPAEYPAQGWKRIVQEGVAPQVDDPPFGLRPWRETARAAWEPAPYPIQVLTKAVQAGAVVAEQPFGKRERLSGLIAAWEQQLIPLWGAAGVQSPDSPIFSGRPWLAVTLRAWEPEWVRPQLARHLVQPTVVAPDAPPITERRWVDTIARAWEPAPYPPQGWRHIVQPTVVAADNPPVSERVWVACVIEEWQPAPYPPQGWRHIVQPTVVAPDNPPVSERVWVACVIEAWQPAPYPPQGWRHIVQPTVVAPDDPPFGLNRRIWTILIAWEPGPPERVIFRHVTAEGVVTPIPASLPWRRNAPVVQDSSRSSDGESRRGDQISTGRRT